MGEQSSWGAITICSFLPTGSTRHLGLELGKRHRTFGLQQGKTAGLLVTSFASKQTLYTHMYMYVCIHIHKHACVYVYMETKLWMDMYSSYFVFKTKRRLVETATMILKDLGVYSCTNTKTYRS